jgi:hypothetical protein
MNCKPMLVSIAILLALTAPRAAETQNGIVEDQFDFNEVHDGGCLGEDIEHQMTITTRSHTIERPNGGVHEVLNWFIEGVTIGVDSELTWYTQHAPSPWVINANDAQGSQFFVLQIPWMPLDGGRRFKETWRFHFVTDGNGVPRVYYDGFEISCIGR